MCRRCASCQPHRSTYLDIISCTEEIVDESLLFVFFLQTKKPTKLRKVRCCVQAPLGIGSRPNFKVVRFKKPARPTSRNRVNTRFAGSVRDEPAVASCLTMVLLQLRFVGSYRLSTHILALVDKVFVGVLVSLQSSNTADVVVHLWHRAVAALCSC